jgi:hypothetical protein
MKKQILILLTILLSGLSTTAQVGISATNTPPNASAMLDVSSTSKGLLIPRMTTTQKNAIAVKPTGLMVFDISLNQFSYWNGINWIDVAGGTGGANQWATSGNIISNINTGNVGIGTNNPSKKLHISHVGDGILIKSTQSYSTIDIDAFNGDATLRFFKNGIMNWGLGNEPVNSNYVLVNVGKSVPTFFISKTTNNIGINTENPLAPLHVDGFNLLTGGQSSFFYTYNTAFTNSTSGYQANTSILAENGIISKTYLGAAVTAINSDNRIKKDFSLSNNSEDLERLKKIQITNYRMKDVATWGTQTFKKVIAQQVESVYPEVISKTKSVIPDIYALAESVVYDAQNKKLNVSLSKDYGIKIGDKIEFVHPEKGKIQAEVVEVSGKSFTVKNWDYATDKIFVFGREVNDFRSVDYEALSMLGISAIQALAKEVEGLKKENIQLKSDFNKRLESIEASLRLTSQTTIK